MATLFPILIPTKWQLESSMMTTRASAKQRWINKFRIRNMDEMGIALVIYRNMKVLREARKNSI